MLLFLNFILLIIFVNSISSDELNNKITSPLLRGGDKNNNNNNNNNHNHFHIPPRWQINDNNDDKINDYPIVGIFAQPNSDDIEPCNGDCQYIAASYVKYIEGAGARVVPINYHSSKEELDLLLDSLNGFFLPGGGANYPDSVQYVFDKIIERNDNGDYLPLWGTCMGFQWLLVAASKDVNILDPSDGTQMDAYNYSIPLDFTSNAYTSELFSDASPHLMYALKNKNVTMNNHHYGIWTEHFQNTPSLTNFYNILSNNKDRNGNEFVSTIEAKNYPIFGSQWHPEKNNLEWKKDADGTPKEAINHSPDAVAVSQYTANFFVSKTRHNQHTFKDVEVENNALIYNWQPTKTSEKSTFVQKYYFPAGADWSKK